MPNKKQKQTSRQSKRKERLVCPFCGKAHHATRCPVAARDFITSAILRFAVKCIRCNAPTLGGKYCVDCVVDRELGRIISNAG